MPWVLCAKLSLAAVAPLGLTWLVWPDSAAVIAAMAGITVGIIGTFFASPAMSAAAVGAVALGLFAAMVGPDPQTALAMGTVLAGLAGWEAARSPGRAMVGAVFAYLAVLLIPGSTQADPVVLVPLVLSSAWGIGVAVWLGMAGLGRGRHDTLGLARGAALGLFLWLGSGAAVWLVAQIDHPKSYWIALLFVLRGLDPADRTVRSALRFGLGATAGVAAALLLEALGLTQVALIAIAMAVAVLGLRTLPHPRPYATACFSAAILLATAPTTTDAVMRLEAVGLAVLLTAILAGVIGLAWAFWARLSQTTRAAA